MEQCSSEVLLSCVGGSSRPVVAASKHTRVSLRASLRIKNKLRDTHVASLLLRRPYDTGAFRMLGTFLGSDDRCAVYVELGMWV